MIYLIILIVILFIIVKYKQSIAWIAVYFITNPASLSDSLLSKQSLSGIFYIDIFFILTFIALLFGRYQWSAIKKDRLLLGILVTLFLFSIYKAVIWGYIIPNVDRDYWVKYCLIRERDSIYGFLFIIPIYLLALKNLKTFFYVIIIFDFIILLASIISIATGSNLIPINSAERYLGSGIMRYYFNSYGLLFFVVPASIVVYLSKVELKYKRILFYGGLLSIISIIISLTKGLYLGLFGIALASIFLAIKLLKVRITKGIRRIIIFSVILIFALLTLFPKYSGYSSRAFSDIFLLATKGETSVGETSRYWQIPALVYEIKRNPFFGTGQGYKQLSKQFDINQFDATDLPLLAHIMQYGIIGILICLFYYFEIFALIKKTYLSVRKFPKSIIVKEFKYEIVFAIGAMSFFIGYLMRSFQIFIELTRGADRIEMSIYTGLLLACFERIKNKSSQMTSPILDEKVFDSTQERIKLESEELIFRVNGKK